MNFLWWYPSQSIFLSNSSIAKVSAMSIEFKKIPMSKHSNWPCQVLLEEAAAFSSSFF